MRIRIAVPEAFVEPGVIDAALESVTRMDEHMIRAGQVPTSRELIAKGAVWRPENPGDEHFDHGGTIAQRGWGDCDDWAPLHAATLRADGTDPGAIARVVPSGPNTYHAIVQRSDGSIEDPSIAAGMKAHRVSGISEEETIQVWACDPHDGRIYQGQLAPTVGPLSLHCGVGWAVRKAHVVGYGNVYEARCDVPLNGSPLVHVRSHRVRAYNRHRPGHRVHGTSVVGEGALPYALSCTAVSDSPLAALNSALCGAICCGDAAELATSLDRYKLLAVQAAMAGATPGQVHQALVHQLTQDLQAKAAATGTHPQQHSAQLLAELAAEGIAQGAIVGDLFGDIGKIASGVVHTVSNVVNDVAKVVKSVPWGDILHGVQAAVSVVPGLGTAVSDVVAAAETAYESAAALLSGNPFAGALHAAYNFATATIPGAAAIRLVLDPVVNALIDLTVKHEPIESVALDALLNAVPDAPKLGSVSPRTIAASLGHMIVNHLGVKHSDPSAKPAPNVQAAVQAIQQAAPALAKAPAAAVLPLHLVSSPVVHHTPAQILAANKARARQTAARPAVRAAMPRPVLHLGPAPALAKAAAAVKPLGVPHAAVHVDTVPPAKPGSPGAPPGATHWICAPGTVPGTWACHWQ